MLPPLRIDGRTRCPARPVDVVIDGVTWLACTDGMIEEALVCFDSYALMQGMGIARPVDG